MLPPVTDDDIQKNLQDFPFVNIIITQSIPLRKVIFVYFQFRAPINLLLFCLIFTKRSSFHAVFYLFLLDHIKFL